MICDTIEVTQCIQDTSYICSPYAWDSCSNEDNFQEKVADLATRLSGEKFSVFGKVNTLDGLRHYDGDLLLLDQWLYEVEQHLRIRNLPIHGGYYSGSSSDGTISSSNSGSEASWAFMVLQLRKVTEKLTGEAMKWYERYCSDGFMPPNCWKKNRDKDYAGEIGLYALLAVHFRAFQEQNTLSKPFCDLKLPSRATDFLHQKERTSPGSVIGKIQSLIRCYNCYGYGHLARKCSSPPTIQSFELKGNIQQEGPAHIQVASANAFTPPRTPVLSPLYRTSFQSGINQSLSDISNFPVPSVPLDVYMPQRPAFRSHTHSERNSAAVRYSRSIREDMILEPTFMYLLQGLTDFPPELLHAIKDIVRFRGLQAQDGVVMDRKKRIVVSSPTEREKLFRDFHKSSGHQYISGTMTAIAETYWWPCLARFVQSRISYCQECLKYGRPVNTANTVAFPTLPSHIFERWMVTVSPVLKTTSGGNSYLVIATEISTRWVEAIPVPNNTPATVAMCLTKIFQKFGTAKFLQSDDGAVFINAVIDELYTLSDGCIHISTPYHPRTRGWIEKINTSGLINRLLKENLAEWDEDPLEVSLNTQRISPDPATGESPFWLVWGEHPSSEVPQSGTIDKRAVLERIQDAFALNLSEGHMGSGLGNGTEETLYRPGKV